MVEHTQFLKNVIEKQCRSCYFTAQMVCQQVPVAEMKELSKGRKGSLRRMEAVPCSFSRENDSRSYPSLVVSFSSQLSKHLGLLDEPMLFWLDKSCPGARLKRQLAADCSQALDMLLGERLGYIVLLEIRSSSIFPSKATSSVIDEANRGCYVGWFMNMASTPA